MGKIVQKDGFPDSLSATLELVGILENIKMKEMERLKTFMREDLDLS